MGQYLSKNLPGGHPTGCKARQVECSCSGQLNITALKTGILRPDDKTEANSTDNSKNLKGDQDQIFWQTLEMIKGKTKNTRE